MDVRREASTWSEEDLLAAARHGEPAAFEAFAFRYGRGLMAFGMRMCGQREDAEDVLQETLLKAFLGLKDVREPRAIRTWLFRVAANQCLMKRRSEKHGQDRTLSIEEFAPPGWETGQPVDIPDWSGLPDEGAERAELREALEQALAEVPFDYRIVVVLRDVEGLSTEETADILGLRPSAVKMRLHRARLALRQHLAHHHENTRKRARRSSGRPQ
jgi:RNA polymerase sigma-70 factor (ECF subfamily)